MTSEKVEKGITPYSISPLRGGRNRGGDFVNFTGSVFVARDATLKKLKNFKKLKDAFVYLCGPIIKNGRVVSAGPTTTSRMKWAFEKMKKAGVRGIIGKGRVEKEDLKGIIYLEAAGGCGALYASKVKRFKIVAFKNLGPQALMKFEVEEFPVLVSK